ncbi:MAG: AAA family ATPase [Candidatus Cryptobacteroides sp.]|nr:AAA family ATPase [Candidatus Cryptobacteroides sp.]
MEFYPFFRKAFPYSPTPCQERLLRAVSAFLSSDDGDILVVNGYAGTGKTTAMAAVVAGLAALEIPSVLLAPTGRAAKVLSQYAGHPASTIHKHIYRQKSLSAEGVGAFTLTFNKARSTLFIVDEVSLIGLSDGFGTGNLLEDLVAFVRAGTDCRLILMGDAAQLPPVGLDASPALSASFMNGFGGVSYVELTTVVRQAADSGILTCATQLRQLLPYSFGPLKLSVFPDVRRISGGELLEALSDAYGRYGEDEVMVLCRSNKRAGRYNAGIRSSVLYHEERLVRGERLMIVRNHYLDGLEGTDYIANGDMAKLVWIKHFEERYGLHFADACLSFPDYGDQEVEMKVLLDVLESDAPSLGQEAAQALFTGVLADYADLPTKKKRYDAVRSDPFFNALQINYAHAITCHKAQGGQWKCVFVDNPFWQDELQEEDLKWLYTALTRAVEQVYLVNFRDSFFA